VDIVNLIENDQAEDSSDTGDGSETEIRIGIMSLGDQGDFVFQMGEELIVVVQKF